MESIKQEIKFYQELRYEQCHRKIEDIDSLSIEQLKLILKELKDNKKYEDINEPSSLELIIKNSEFPDISFKINNYQNRLLAALYARFAGCLLGVPVEGYSINQMEDIAKRGEMDFPPKDYWTLVEPSDFIQYGVDLRGNYSKGKIDAVLVDDDISYTVLNVLLMEKYGVNYSIDDVAKLWLDILPYACTAEDEALKELKKGTDPLEVAENNPFIEWIGAAIRADAFGYVYAGRPKEAALHAYNDAYLTHRRNGIYGEMFLSSSIAAAFGTKNVMEALKIGARYIPNKSRLYVDLMWAFAQCQNIKDFKQARELIDKRYPTMNSVHTNNNMIAIVFACYLAGQDFTNAIGISVAMGLDNDCTSASIGSIYGANLGLKGISSHWYKCFNNTIKTYIKGYEKISFDELISKILKIRETIK